MSTPGTLWQPPPPPESPLSLELWHRLPRDVLFRALNLRVDLPLPVVIELFAPHLHVPLATLSVLGDEDRALCGYDVLRRGDQVLDAFAPKFVNSVLC